MIGINREWLLDAKAWAEKEIERVEIRRANRPMIDTVQSRTETLTTQAMPDIMAGRLAAVRDSVLKLEHSLSDSDARQAKAEESRQRRLVQADARTKALHEWLEALG